MLKKRKCKKRSLVCSRGTYLKDIIEQFSPGNICEISVYDELKKNYVRLSEADIINGFLIKGYYSKIEDIF